MKRLYKILLIFLGGIGLIISVLYFWLIYRAEDVLQELVASESNNTLSLQLEKIQFSPYSLRLLIHNAQFRTVDSIDSPSSYDVRVQEISMKLSGLAPLIFGKNLIVESIVCVSPEVKVTQRKKIVDTSKFSLPDEMGKIYGSILKTLSTFQIQYFLLDSGRLTLHDRTIPNANPVSLSDIRLEINNLKIDRSVEQQDKILFSDKIQFTINRQNIVSADGNHGIQFSKLGINTEKRVLEIDSCYVYGKKPDSLYGEFGIFFDTLRLTNTDLNALIERDLIKVDTALCINPDIRMSFELKEGQRKKSSVPQHTRRQDVEAAFKKLLGNLDVDYVGIENAGISITIKQGDKIRTRSSLRNSFSIHDVLSINHPDTPFRIGRFDFAIRNYLTYSPDSSYFLRFDSIHLLNQKIYLKNFVIGPTEKNLESDYKEIKMGMLEMSEVSWFHLIFQNRIVAGSASMLKPEINFILNQKRKKSTQRKKSIFDVFAGIRKEIEIQNIYAKDALVSIRGPNNYHIRLENVNSNVLVDVLLDSRGIYEIIQSVKEFSFSRGILSGSRNSLVTHDGHYSHLNKRLHVRKLQLESVDKTVFADIEDLEIENPERDEDDVIAARAVDWKKANIRLLSSNPSTTSGNSAANQRDKKFLLKLGAIHGRNTTFHIGSSDLESSVYLQHIEANSLVLNGENTPQITGLKIAGRLLQFQNKSLSLQAGDFMIVDRQPSSINRVNMRIAGEKDTIHAALPHLNFSPDISRLLKNELVLGDILLQSPVISLDQSQDTSAMIEQKKESKLPKIDINSLTIINPVLERVPENLSKKLHLGLNPSQWRITGIHSDGSILTVQRIGGAISEATVQTEKISAAIEENGHVSIVLKNLQFSPGNDTSKAKWSANLDSLAASSLAIKMRKKDSSTVQMELRSIAVQDLRISSDQRLKVEDVFNRESSFRLNDGNFTINSSRNHFYVSNLSYQNEHQRISMDSFSYSPVLNREDFMKTKKFQTDYIQVQTGKIEVNRFDLDKYFKDSIFSVGTVDVYNARLLAYKDKRLPFQSGLNKPLPTTIFQRIDAKLQVDSIRIFNARITYEELNEKTLKNGAVVFSETYALITGIKNLKYSPTDSLRLQARSRLMDSAFIRFRFSESYTDTLHAFLMALRVRPFYIPSLNPMLEPLASARINNGWVDTIRMKAIGREYVAWGKMEMEYRDLKIQVLNKGDENKLTLKTKLITWVANAFVLKSKNTKTGVVYAERIPDRGIFNYWLKIALSGILTNTGVKTNKKQEKKYYKQIKKLNVPEIPDVEL